MNQDLIYISHSAGDFEIALAIKESLESHGFQIIDLVSKKSDSDNEISELEKSADEIEAVLLLLSLEAFQNKGIQMEIDFAIAKNIPIYPINLSNIEKFDALLPKAWKYWLGITQIHHFSSPQEASKKLKFILLADSAARFSTSLNSKELISNAWRVLESLLTEAENAKMGHSYLDFTLFNENFEKNVISGLTSISQGFENYPSKIESQNRFAGRLLFILFTYLQYWDCHSLNIDRRNECGLSGHEVETLVNLYIKPAALQFYYPSAFSLYIETQFLWNYDEYVELYKPLLNQESFMRAKEILKRDLYSFYCSLVEDREEEIEFTPEIGLDAHIFDYFCKCIFYMLVDALKDKTTSLEVFERALDSIDMFLTNPKFALEGSDYFSKIREDLLLEGFSMLLLLKISFLCRLGEYGEAKSVFLSMDESDLKTLDYFLLQKLNAATGTAKHILEELYENYTKYRSFETSKDIETQEIDHERRYLPVAEQLFLLGARFEELGEFEKALELWARSARAGVLPSLSSFTWTTLKTGAFVDGIALFEECQDIQFDSAYEIEKINSRLNYILNLIANDSNFSAGISHLNSLIINPESKFSYESHLYLAVLESISGNKLRAKEIIKSIPEENLQNLIETCEIELIRARGWLQDWLSMTKKVLIEFNKLV